MSEQKKILMHEDWSVVLLGTLIIILSISGLILEVPAFGWSNSSELYGKVLSVGNLSLIFIQLIYVSIIAAIGAFLTSKPIKHFLFGFPLVYLITIIALILAGNSQLKAINLEAVIFSLGLGLVISNFFKLPEWLRASLSTELFVKIGLVLLGTSVIFSDVLKAGSLGLIQA